MFVENDQVGIMLQTVVSNLDDALGLVGIAISTALERSKPVYVSIACNFPGILHPTFAIELVTFYLASKYVVSCSLHTFSTLRLNNYFFSILAKECAVYYAVVLKRECT